jgi:predicted PurR-regulated permease PerM
MTVTPELNSMRDEEVKRESVSLAFSRRVLITTLVVVSVVLVLLFVWYEADLLMLVIAGVLVSNLLRGFSRNLSEKTGMGRGVSLVIVALALVALIAAAAWLITGRIGSQISELRQQLPLARGFGE